MAMPLAGVNRKKPLDKSKPPLAKVMLSKTVPVGKLSTGDSRVEPAKTRASPAKGATLSDQLAAVIMLLSPPPPSQVRVAPTTITVLSVLLDAMLALPARSCATLAAVLTITVPG